MDKAKKKRQKGKAISDAIKLQGGTLYICQDNDCAFRVSEGPALVFLLPLEQGGPGRRLFIRQAEVGEILPSLKMNQDGQEWRLAFAALEKTALELLPGANDDRLKMDFAQRIELPITEATDFAPEMVERYQLNLVKEEGYIYATGREQKAVYERGLNIIYRMFSKEKLFSSKPSGNRLYDAVQFLCRAEAMEAVPFETMRGACGPLFQVEDIARLSHFTCRDVVLEQDWFKHDNGPLLVWTTDRKPLVCLSKNAHTYMAYDAESGGSRVVDEALSQSISPEAKMIYRPLPQRKLNIKDLLAFSFHKLPSRDVAAFFSLALLGMLVALLIPYMNEQLYDRFIPMSDSHALIQVCLVIIACIMGKLSFTVIKNMALFRVSSSVRYKVQSAIFDRLFSLPQQFIDKYDSADLSLRAYGLDQVFKTISDTMVTAATAALFSLLYLFRMFRFAPALTWWSLLFLALSMALIIYLGQRQLKYENEFLQLQSKTNSLMYQFLGGISKIRIAGVENRALYEYLRPYTDSEAITLRKERLTVLANTIVGAMPTLFSVFFYYMLIRKDMDVTIGGFMGFIAAFGALSAALLALTQAFIEANAAIPAYRRAKPILETVPELEDGAVLPGRLSGAIEADHLRFSYEGSDEVVIDDISFSIRPGEYIGIVGSSGCGKSTLLKLLLGFEKPKSGKIYYDGKDIDSLDKRELRKKLGVVLQNGQLIAGSIYDNITIAAPKMRIRQVEKIIDAVGLKEDVAELPMGLHTVLSEDSGTISGGQKQRILIARAIAGDPRIIFFDEATSSLDNVTQRQVCDNLAHLNATRLVIAHRLSTVIDCDRIFVMDKGRIVEEGNYQQLMARKGVFAQLAARQML